MPQITIVILQYRPDAAALRRTLASLAMQDTRDFAVVLGDDGSAQDYFAESRAYLAAHGITDVQTTKLQPNGGTVKNARNAVRAAATRWVLMLSPGDFLYDSETLRSLSGAFIPAQLLANLQSIQDALTAMAAQPNPRIAAELCLIRLCRPELCDDVPTLCARVDKLEQAVRSGDIPAPAAAAPAKPAPAPQLEPVPKSSPAQKAQPKPEPKPVYDDVPPWEPPPESMAPPEERPPWEMPPAPKPKPRPAPKAAPAPEPAAPTIPEPEPSPEPAPQTEPTPAPTGAFDWQALCAYMEHELPVGIYHFLLDPLQAAGELADGTLTLHLNKAPAYPMFNKPDIAEKFRLAVQKLTGQNVRVVMQPMDTATQIKQRQIEELTRFPNVTIR